MKEKKKNIIKLNPYNIKEKNINENDNNKYIGKIIENKISNENKKEYIHKSPTTFRKKIINNKPIFQRKIINEKFNHKSEKNKKEIENSYALNKIKKDEYNKNNEINYNKNILIKKIKENINNHINKKEKIEDIKKVNILNNNIEKNIFDKNINNKDNNHNDNEKNNNKLNDNIINEKIIKKKKKPKRKVFEYETNEDKKNTDEKTDTNNLNNKNIDNIFCSFGTKFENNNEIIKNENKELKEIVDESNEKNKKEGIYKSNDLERIIKENKNTINIKKPNSNINTIFNYIENEYNVSEEENNCTNCDKSFSFRQKFTGNFGQEGKNTNNENDKESEKDVKFSFKINSDLNESEFNDINYF